MTARTEKLPDEPIILVTFEGFGGLDVVLDIYAASAAFADQYPHDLPLWRVWDARQGKANFADALSVIKEAQRADLPGSAADKRFLGVFVGTGEIIRLTADAFSKVQFGGHNVPIFKELDEALSYVRMEVAKRGKNQST